MPHPGEEEEDSDILRSINGNLLMKLIKFLATYNIIYVYKYMFTYIYNIMWGIFN